MSRTTHEGPENSPEQLLAMAGIAATIVDACADSECGWCQPKPVTLAA